MYMKIIIIVITHYFNCMNYKLKPIKRLYPYSSKEIIDYNLLNKLFKKAFKEDNNIYNQKI